MRTTVDVSNLQGEASAEADEADPESELGEHLSWAMSSRYTYCMDSSKPADSRGEENLLLALDMFSTGITLMRERLERENPELSPEAISELITSYLAKRPLDAPGRIVRGPRVGRPTSAP